MTNNKGVEIEIGDFVVAGAGEDRDYGRVTSIQGDVIFVTWHQGVSGPVGADHCSVYASASAAATAAFGAT